MKDKEIRIRLPRLVMNLVMVFIFWIISIFVPPTVHGIELIGLANLDLEFLASSITIIIMAIFLIRALSDALILGDVVTNIVIKRLGIKEERSPKRAARDFIYIIITILVVTAVSPFLNSIEEILHLEGEWLNNIITILALGLIILLIYDIGRILHQLLEKKAEILADRLSKMAGKNGD